MSAELDAVRLRVAALDLKIERLKLELAEAKAREGLEPSATRTAEIGEEFTVYQGRLVLREAARRGDWREVSSFGDGAGAQPRRLPPRRVASQQGQAAAGGQIVTAEAVPYRCMRGRA